MVFLFKIEKIKRIWEVDEKYYADEEDAYNMRRYFQEEDRVNEKAKKEGKSIEKTLQAVAENTQENEKDKGDKEIKLKEKGGEDNEEKNKKKKKKKK